MEWEVSAGRERKRMGEVRAGGIGGSVPCLVNRNTQKNIITHIRDQVRSLVMSTSTVLQKGPRGLYANRMSYM